ncbi:hypothetical protein ACFL52_01565 [Candidatus Margulisiibacteriota bacterium]
MNSLKIISIKQQLARVSTNRGKPISMNIQTPNGHSMRASDVIGKSQEQIDRRMIAVDKMRSAGTMDYLWRLGNVEEVEVGGITWEILPGIEVDSDDHTVGNIRLYEQGAYLINEYGMLNAPYNTQISLIERIKQEMGINVNLLEPDVAKIVMRNIKNTLEQNDLYGYYGNGSIEDKEKISNIFGYDLAYECVNFGSPINDHALCHLTRSPSAYNTPEIHHGKPIYYGKKNIKLSTHSYSDPTAIFIRNWLYPEWLGMVIGRPKADDSIRHTHFQSKGMSTITGE